MLRCTCRCTNRQGAPGYPSGCIHTYQVCLSSYFHMNLCGTPLSPLYYVIVYHCIGSPTLIWVETYPVYYSSSHLALIDTSYLWTMWCLLHSPPELLLDVLASFRGFDIGSTLSYIYTLICAILPNRQRSICMHTQNGIWTFTCGFHLG